MSSIVLLEGFDPPKTCLECPFFNEDEDLEMDICTALSICRNRAIEVNRYSNKPDRRCPFHQLAPNHGRILDERDIRAEFASMQFGLREVKFSMQDVFNNISNVDEIAPRYRSRLEMFARRVHDMAEDVKDNMRAKEDIEKEIEDAGEDSGV